MKRTHVCNLKLPWLLEEPDTLFDLGYLRINILQKGHLFRSGSYNEDAIIVMALVSRY